MTGRFGVAAADRAPAPALEPIEKHYDPEAAAEMLSLSVPTIRALERRGDLRGVRLAGRLRFAASEIAAYIDRCKDAPRRTAPPELLKAGGRPRGRRRR